MGLVLVVEDEVDLNNLIRDQLVAAGHSVEQAFDGGSAVAAIEKTVPDLVLLDWMLPDLDGLTVCRQIRQRHVMPVIMLTARTDEVDRVLGLEVGADDYVTKPFSMRELLARVRANLRRVEFDGRPTEAATEGDGGTISLGGLIVDPSAHAASVDGASLNLTPKEFQLLHLFAANPGRAFSREFLIERVWNGDFEGYDRAVDTHITRLRRKLGRLGDQVQTVWGVGYRFTRPKA
ncbi:MAG: response regulator transcription factor [Chloroflexi bacterium]|nr:MAG: response regulator transcription factor [Chloroflexota bacterium]TMD55011.1 MAG: response regulator transcription factor [Chloroflexota bacterium]